MKRLTVFIAFVLVGAVVLAACGGGADSGGAGGSTQSQAQGESSGAGGLKDPALLGKWISADGGSGYDFKDDFSVVVTNVGSETNSTYSILEGGNGAGKVEIVEGANKVVWDYKITEDRIEFTTPEGRARRMRKTQ